MITNKPKKVNRKSLVTKLDNAFSKVVRLVGECERCGEKKNLQCCHINSRKFYHTRWHELNAVCMCAGCHFWSHQHPRAFGKWVDWYYGEGTMDDMDKLSLCTETMRTEELLEIYEKLKIQLNGSKETIV